MDQSYTRESQRTIHNPVGAHSIGIDRRSIVEIDADATNPAEAGAAAILPHPAVLMRKALKFLSLGRAAIKRRPMFAAVGMLVSGTGLAALISAAVLPILTRLYDPADFSALAAISGLVSIVSVSASLRFDVAITLPERDDDAANLLANALLSAVCVTLLVCAAVLFAGETLLAITRQSRISAYIWIFPLGVIAISSNVALQNWLIREKDFGFIAWNKVLQTTVMASTQLASGLFGWGAFGLILSPTLGFLGASVSLLVKILKRRRNFISSIRVSRMLEMGRRYHRFPKYSALEAFANACGMQLPILIIAAVAPAHEAGQLLLALVIIQAPIGLLGTAISQVFLSLAPAEHRASRLAPFTAGVFGSLVKTGVGPILFGGILAPELFGKIFGSDWERAGVLLAWMAPWFVMQYLASPISMALHVAGRQLTALTLQVFGVLFRAGSVFFAEEYWPSGLSEMYAISGLAFYFGYLVVVLKVTGMSFRMAIDQVSRGAPLSVFWICAALLLRYLLS